MSSETATTEEIAKALSSIHTESGADLLALAEESPVLLVFLRHFGCSFCRQAISDVAGVGGELKTRGVRPVFVHLGTPEIAKATFDYYGLDDVERVNDPRATVYQLPVFALSRKNPLAESLRPSVVFRWLNGTVFKHGIGKVENDAHQMPGVFFLKGPMIVRRFIHKTIADQPDYLKLVS